MPAPDQAVLGFAPAALDVRALARRVGPPALFAGALVATLLLAGGRVHALTDALRRGLGAGAGAGLLGAAFECASLVGYIGLLSLVAGSASRRVGVRQSAQITLAGTAATRVLPTAGAGGVALTLWTLRRAGLRPLAAARTMLVFLVLLYSVFLVSIAGSGASWHSDWCAAADRRSSVRSRPPRRCSASGCASPWRVATAPRASRAWPKTASRPVAGGV